MANEKCLLLESELHKLHIGALEETVKRLTKQVAELEDEEDGFKVRNCVRLKDQNDDMMLEVTQITSKSVWVRQGDNKVFLKHKDKLEKI